MFGGRRGRPVPDVIVTPPQRDAFHDWRTGLVRLHSDFDQQGTPLPRNCDGSTDCVFRIV